MKRRIPFALAVILAAGIACEGTSGSAVGGSESCQRSGNGGTCTGTYSKISGAFGKTIESNTVHTKDGVPVEVTISVQSGTLRVSVKAPDGTLASAEATPGNPATLSGTATGGVNDFTVTFEAVGGDASGVTYTIAYQTP